MQRAHAIVPWRQATGPQGTVNQPALPDGFIGNWTDITGQDAAKLYAAPAVLVIDVTAEAAEIDKLEADPNIIVLLREDIPNAQV